MDPRPVVAAMCAGCAVLVGVAAFLSGRAPAAPDPAQVKTVNLLTQAAMLWALGLIVASEWVWKRLLGPAPRPGESAPREAIAFVVRAALREAAAIGGGAVLLVAAASGTLNAYPSYWVNAVPAGLFGLFAWLRWPSPESLKDQAHAARAS